MALRKRDLAGRPRLINNKTPRDREILLCSDADDPPYWGFGIWDSITGKWFAGDADDLEDLHVYGPEYNPEQYYWKNPTHWGELPALPPQRRFSLH